MLMYCAVPSPETPDGIAVKTPGTPGSLQVARTPRTPGGFHVTHTPGTPGNQSSPQALDPWNIQLRLHDLPWYQFKQALATHGKKHLQAPHPNSAIVLTCGAF